jgi:hypothetical protein
VIAVLAAVVAAVAVPVQDLQYERPLRPSGPGPAEIVPDGPMFAHARGDFSDVRIADASGRQVPWRPLPPPPATAPRSLMLLDAGRRGSLAVARVDLGAGHGVVDRLTLDIPDRRFHGSLTVLGSDDRRTWTKLSTTEIYAVGGARPARSTTALLPPTDYRYLELRATHVSRIAGAFVSRTPEAPTLRPVPSHAGVGVDTVVVDLGYPNVPVDELRISASTPRYARPFTVFVGTTAVAAGDLVRVGAPRQTIVPLAVRARYLRIRIDNGDNPPLTGLRVETLARPRTLLVEGGHGRQLTLLYGGSVRPPEYDFARLPRSALPLSRARPAALGLEVANARYRLADTRSFVARHGFLVTLALVLAAAAVMGAAALILRRGART